MATPSQVLIIRHGEKPGDPAVDCAGDGDGLSVRGEERAAALAKYIPATFGRPDFLFATQPSRHSNRTVETITPLEEELATFINTEHPNDDFARVASDLFEDPKYAGKRVLICWHHGRIPDLTVALRGIPPHASWPGEIFDRVWQINYPPGIGPHQTIPVLDLPQRLLYEDAID
jgi:hypothetical protein